MPVTRRSRIVPAPREAVWEVVADPMALVRWWPRVERVENASRGRWTTVMRSKRGRTVRADHRLVEWREPEYVRWRQELEGSPFERLLSEAATEVELAAADPGTRVTIRLTQRLRGWSRFGGLLFRMAARKQLDEALAALDAAVPHG